VIKLLRAAGYDRPIYLHGAHQELCALYERLGVALGPLASVPAGKAEALAGAIVMAPPSAIGDRWSRRLPEPIPAFASGWMRVRARARQRAVELPLVISDHADWDELTRTFDDVEAEEVWVTHGQEEALVHYATSRGRRARALALVGRDEEDEPELPGLDVT
jgi:putative mRNA 3-end processing factor